jgi:hypothetical protein
MAATQRPVALAALEEPASVAGWRSHPVYALLTTEDKNIPIQAQRFMTERAKATSVEVAASHAVSVSMPSAVSDLIMTAAK